MVSHYLARNSPRELNLSHRDREGVLHALQHTTHPSALALINATVEATLRGQSHPNFVRWSICNGNKPRQVFVRNISIGHVMAGLFMAVLLILSHASRWWRLFVFPLIFVGFDVGVAAYKGLCVILHTNNNRALRPWEDLDDTYSLSNLDRNAAAATEANASTDDVFSTHSRSTTISLDPFGSSNNLSHELLIERYKKIPLMKKIFAKRVLVQNEAIRLMQDKIVLQSHGWALIITLILTAALVALPKGNVI